MYSPADSMPSCFDRAKMKRFPVGDSFTVISSISFSAMFRPAKKARRMPKGRAGAKYGGRQRAGHSNRVRWSFHTTNFLKGMPHESNLSEMRKAGHVTQPVRRDRHGGERNHLELPRICMPSLQHRYFGRYRHKRSPGGHPFRHRRQISTIHPSRRTSKVRLCSAVGQMLEMTLGGFLRPAQVVPMDIWPQLFALHRAARFTLNLYTERFANALAYAHCFAQVSDCCFTTDAKRNLFVRRELVEVCAQGFHAQHITEQ